MLPSVLLFGFCVVCSGVANICHSMRNKNIQILKYETGEIIGQIKIH